VGIVIEIISIACMSPQC